MFVRFLVVFSHFFVRLLRFYSLSLRFLCAFCVFFLFSWCVLRIVRGFSARCFWFSLCFLRDLCVFCFVCFTFLCVFCLCSVRFLCVLCLFSVHFLSFLCVFCVCEGVLASKLDAHSLNAKHELRVFLTIFLSYLLLLLLLLRMCKPQKNAHFKISRFNATSSTLRIFSDVLTVSVGILNIFKNQKCNSMIFKSQIASWNSRNGSLM